ncbi:hypothetical protein GCM10010911_67900 [Paenibacillus nasutitermitis]|uniref:Uncharacterized protein n=1 Tax=Paenibacillus nasutitermitis TaxID=1652958 RepID=A0A916ZID1_9BACL|nr:hypothetical protein GCM10010911_67900 [Paenibacillus nasutitermitis]
MIELRKARSIKKVRINNWKFIKYSITYNFGFVSYFVTGVGISDKQALHTIFPLK